MCPGLFHDRTFVVIDALAGTADHVVQTLTRSDSARRGGAIGCRSPVFLL
jgi:hypothetical protein